MSSLNCQWHWELNFRSTVRTSGKVNETRGRPPAYPRPECKLDAVGNQRCRGSLTTHLRESRTRSWRRLAWARAGQAHMHACTERVTTRDMEFDDVIFTNVCTVQLESHHILKERTAHQIQNETILLISILLLS